MPLAPDAGEQPHLCVPCGARHETARRRCRGTQHTLQKPSSPERAMGQRLLSLAGITSAAALECWVGRAHDGDLKAHSDQFVDGVALQTCPSDSDACCVTFEAARCVPPRARFSFHDSQVLHARKESLRGVRRGMR